MEPEFHGMAGIIVLYQKRPNLEYILTKPQQASQIEPELGKAYAQGCIIYLHSPMYHKFTFKKRFYLFLIPAGNPVFLYYPVLTDPEPLS